MNQPAPDMQLASAVASRVSGCTYRELVRMAKFMGIKRAHMITRWNLELEVKRIVLGRSQLGWY